MRADRVTVATCRRRISTHDDGETWRCERDRYCRRRGVALGVGVGVALGTGLGIGLRDDDPDPDPDQRQRAVGRGEDERAQGGVDAA